MKAHASNVAALDQVLRLATKHSDSYKPSNKSIERTALTALIEEAQKSIQAVHKAESDLAKAINFRQRAFEQVPLLGTRIISIAEAGGLEPDHLEDLNRIRKRFRSQPFKGTAQKKGPGHSDQITQAIPAPSAEIPVRKNRQLNFDSVADNFAAMIQFLEGEPSYAPAEAQFTIEALREMLAELQSTSVEVNDAKSALNSARILRSQVFFNPDTGVYPTGKKVKRYFRGLFGTTSEQYSEISKIKFVTR